MKLIYCISICLLTNIGVFSQYLSNPSFEGPPGPGNPPPNWHPCHELSTPDTQPGAWEITAPASEGETYMGMVTRGNGGSYPVSWEDCLTSLTQPLLIGHCYLFSIDLAMSSVMGHTNSTLGWISYSNPVILRLYGSDIWCYKKELVWESPAISDTVWQSFETTISPIETEFSHLIFEVYYAQLPEYFGNMQLDNSQISYLSLSPEVNLGADTSICEEETIILNAGSGFSTYLWQDGSTNQYINANDAGIYWVEVSNEMGCAARDSITVYYFPKPEINIGNDTLICEGDNLILNAGSGYNSYNWNTGSIDSSIIINAAGIYWIEITNELGCSNIDSITVGYYANPMELNLGSDTSFCSNEYFVINAGSGYTSYEWQDGSTDSILTTNTPGTYYVNVTNPCGSATDTLHLEHYPLIEADLGKDSLLCFGENLLLDPGSDFISYLWQDGSTNQFYYTGQTGLYWVDVTDTNTCHNIDSIYLEFILPDPELGSDTIMCPWDSITFYANNDFVTYLWHNNTNQNYFTADTSGIFWCEVIDTMGCIGRDTVLLNILPPPQVFLGNDTSICSGDTLLLDPNFNNFHHTFLWYNGSTDSTTFISEQGPYWLEVTNVCGSDKDSIFLSLIPLPTIFLGNDTVLSINDELTLDAGTGFENYLWNDGSKQQTITVFEGGSYWVNIFDGQCYNADTITIEPIDCDIFIPIVFTPNGDGYNDYFFAMSSSEITDFHLSVFNRWGETIWETQDKDGKWDGQKGASKADEGTYFWVLTYKCLASPVQFEKKGSVTLLR